MPRTWSPSTTRPSASTAMSRSASPSSAKPTSAPAATTASASDAGAVAPDRTLMLIPSGDGVDDVEPRAGRRQDLRARRREPEPFAASRTRCRWRASIDLGEAEPVDAVVGQAPRASIIRPRSSFATPPQLLGPPDQRLELVLDRVVELEPGGVEDLEPVVGGRVVRGGDHDPGGERPLAGDEREGRRRHDADDVDVDAEAGRPGDDGGHEHVARAARVLADDDRPAAADQPMGDRAPEGVGQGRLEVDVGDAADAVGAEQAGHRRQRRRRRATARRRRARGDRDRRRSPGRRRRASSRSAGWR